MSIRFCLVGLLFLTACGDDVPIGPNPSPAANASGDADATVVDAAAEVVGDGGEAGTDVTERPDASQDAAPDTQPDLGIAPCSVQSCDDKNPCTTDSCAAGQCDYAANVASCDDDNACTGADKCAAGVCGGTTLACNDWDACTADSCAPATGCFHSAIVDACGNGVCGCGETPDSCAVDCFCGNGDCDGLETASTCVGDCGFLVAHTTDPCTTPGSWTGCAYGYVCVARSAVGGGNICVADFDTWGVLADGLSEFTDHVDSIRDARTGLEWAKATLEGQDWTSALSVCTTQSYGGHLDWRLPTIAELTTLVDFSAGKPACIAPGLDWPATTWDWPYWGNVSDLNGAVARSVRFDDGALDGAGYGAAGRARCVRGGTDGSAPSGQGSRFSLAEGGKVILDRLTNLRWQADVDLTFYAWNDAKLHCANGTPNLPGKGWRLPTIRELQSIIDRQQLWPATNALFNSTPTLVWSTTQAASLQSDAWFADLASGSSFTGGKSVEGSTQCVRTGSL